MCVCMGGSMLNVNGSNKTACMEISLHGEISKLPIEKYIQYI